MRIIGRLIVSRSDERDDTIELITNNFIKGACRRSCFVLGRLARILLTRNKKEREAFVRETVFWRLSALFFFVRCGSDDDEF